MFFAGQLGVDKSGAFGRAGRFQGADGAGVREPEGGARGGGAGFGHLVKINNYLVDIEQNMAAFREVRDRYLVKPPPASTTIGVPALARPGGLFEIEAIAALPG